jgi:hypothetical protein
MAVCPECGLPPTVLTEDDNTEQPYYQCQNGHQWQEDPGT